LCVTLVIYQESLHDAQSIKYAKCLSNIAAEGTRLIRKRSYICFTKAMVTTLISVTFSQWERDKWSKICTSAPFPRHGKPRTNEKSFFFLGGGGGGSITAFGTGILIYVHSHTSHRYLSDLRSCQQMAHEPNNPSTPASHYTKPLQPTLFIRARISTVKELRC
jgi:hypothetical protein